MSTTGAVPASPASGHEARWQPEKVAACAIVVAPALWLTYLAYDGDLGVRAVHQAVRDSGDWALRLFWLTLFVSPARRIFAAPRLLRTRRILGLGAFGFTLIHIGLYVLDQQFAWGRIGLELVLRLYLTIGTVATIGLAVLAATSSDRALVALGGARWARLHRFVYATAALALVHFMLRSRTDTFEPMLMLGLLAWLVGYRLLQRRGRDTSAPRLALLALAAGAVTAGAEVGWHAAMTGIDPWRVLAAQFDADDGLRPAWWVLIAGSVAALATWRWGLPQRANSAIKASNAASGATRGQSAS